MTCQVLHDQIFAYLSNVIYNCSLPQVPTSQAQWPYFFYTRRAFACAVP